MKYKYRAVWPPPSPSGKLIKRPLVEIEIFGPKGVTGITGDGEVFFKDIEIKIEFLEKKFKLTAGFIKSPYVSVLLGQDGFFDLHRIKFEKDHDTFELLLADK